MSGSYSNNVSIIVEERVPVAGGAPASALDREYRGWTDLRITSSIEQFPASFVLTATGRYPELYSAGVTLEPHMPCRIAVDGETLLTGYIDGINYRIGPTGNTITVYGRGKGADLLDCSLILPQSDVHALTIDSAVAAVRALAEPFGITVIAEQDYTFDPPLVVTLDLGSTPFSVIDEISRAANFLVLDDADGNLVLSRAGTSVHASGLAEGANIEDGQMAYDWRDRFSVYRPLTSGISTRNDAPAELRALTTIPAVEDNLYQQSPYARYRPLSIISEQYIPRGEGAVALAELRAAWEASRRFGRSQIASIVVDNWRDATGQLWSANRRVKIDAPSLRVANREWLIVEVVFERGLNGTRATITAMDPAAYTLTQPGAINAVPLDIAEEIAAERGRTRDGQTERVEPAQPPRRNEGE